MSEITYLGIDMSKAKLDCALMVGEKVRSKVSVINPTLAKAHAQSLVIPPNTSFRHLSAVHASGITLGKPSRAMDGA